MKSLTVIFCVLMTLPLLVSQALAKTDGAILSSVSKQYNQFQTVQDMSVWLGKQVSKEDGRFLLSKVAPVSAMKLPRLTRQGDQFQLHFEAQVIPIKLVDLDSGEIEINRRFVKISLLDLKGTWEQIEKSLPRTQQTSLMNLLIPRAEASMGPFLVPVLAIAAIGAQAAGQIAYTDLRLKKGIRECSMLQESRMFRDRKRTRDEMESQLQSLLKYKNDERECLNNQESDLCQKQKKVNQCVADLEKQFCIRFGCKTRMTAKSGQTSLNQTR